MSHIVRPARREAVVSLPATLRSVRSLPGANSSGGLHEESAVEDCLISSDCAFFILSEYVVQKVSVISSQAVFKSSFSY